MAMTNLPVYKRGSFEDVFIPVDFLPGTPEQIDLVLSAFDIETQTFGNDPKKEAHIALGEAIFVLHRFASRAPREVDPDLYGNICNLLVQAVSGYAKYLTNPHGSTIRTEEMN